MEFSIKDWMYAGEGKVRIALSNRNRHSSFFGTVLLIQKGQQESGIGQKDLQFVNSIIKEWFSGNYISCDLRSIVLNEDTLREILNMVNPNRPITRIREANSNLFQRNATIQRNFCMLQRHIPVTQGLYKDELSLELKVKCGFRAITPFVCDNHARLKLIMSRFHLMQQYKLARKGNNVGWGQFSSIATYNPIDMFSKDPLRIQMALRLLFANPQNNLRVSLNLEHVYGWNKLDTTAMIQSIRHSDLNESCDSPDCPSRVVHAIAVALAEESLLHRMSSMQRLDLLDSEGAHAVFARLEYLVKSSQAALCLLEEQMLKPLDSRVLSWIETESANPEDVDEYASIVGKLVALNVSIINSDLEQKSRLEQAHALVNGASASQCLFLLQLWMLALIAKDASVLITVRRISVLSLDVTGKQVDDMWVCTQSIHNCGSVCSTMPVNGTYEGYAYTVGLIDVGLKSLDKVWQKVTEDAEVCRVVWENISSWSNNLPAYS